MKLENIIYDIRHILNNYTDDSDIKDGYLISRINAFRGVEINNHYEMYGTIPPNIYQTFKDKTVDIVNSADISTISKTSIVFGKYEMPRLVSDLNGNEIKRMTSSSQQTSFQLVEEETAYKMIELEKDDVLNKYTIYFLNEDNVYFYPRVKKISFSAILENPLDGETTKSFTTPQGNLISNEGTVRNLNVTDEYPVTDTMAVNIIINILSRDFNIKLGQIKDLVADNEDQLEVLKNEK